MSIIFNLFNEIKPKNKHTNKVILLKIMNAINIKLLHISFALYSFKESI